MGRIEVALTTHAFEHVRIKCLGWDRFRTIVTAGENGAAMELSGVVQKRHFVVLVSSAHRTVPANRGLLWGVQRQIRSAAVTEMEKAVHESN